MNNFKKLLIILLIVIAAGLVVFRFSQISDSSQVPNESAVRVYEATLTIDAVAGGENFDIPQFIGKSALEATEAMIKVIKTGTGEGAFVMGINGKVADSKRREFWELIVNGKSANVGAGSYKIQNGDKIEWKLSLY